MYPFQKKCCISVDIYLLLDKVRKKEKNTTPMVLHVLLTNERMNNVIHRDRRKKIIMNTNLEFNYFVIIILILVCISKSFLFGLHTTFFNYRAVCCKLV